MAYKTELHCHSQEMSACASQSCEVVAQNYINAGYTSVVLTNHFTVDKVDKFGYENYLHDYFAVEKQMQQAAGDKLNVMIALEVRLRRDVNDYMLYGATEKELLKRPDLLEIDRIELRRFAEENGWLCIHAHPFRYGGVTIRDHQLDGFECYNAHHAAYCNELACYAVRLTQQHFGKKLILTSGSDHHDPENPILGGIETDVPVTNVQQLVHILKTENYRLLMDGVATPLSAVYMAQK